MNFDELGQAWQETNRTAATTERCERLGALVLWRLEWGLDLVYPAICLFFIYFFGSLLIIPGEGVNDDPFPLATRLGLLVIVLGAVFSIYRRYRVRLSNAPSDFNAPVRSFLRNELAQNGEKISLLNSGRAWCHSEHFGDLAPIYLGLTLIRLGWHGLIFDFLTHFVVYSLFAAGFFGATYVFNRFVMSKVLTSRRDQFQDLLDNLEPSEPSD